MFVFSFYYCGHNNIITIDLIVVIVVINGQPVIAQATNLFKLPFVLSVTRPMHARNATVAVAQSLARIHTYSYPHTCIHVDGVYSTSEAACEF